MPLLTDGMGFLSVFFPHNTKKKCPFVSKIIEHFVSHNIPVTNFLEANSLHYEHQHGFRSKHGCDTQLLNTVTEFIDYFDELTPIDITVLDFSKAFEVVSHRKLRSKLLNIGVHTKTIARVSSWLKYRSLSMCQYSCQNLFFPVVAFVQNIIHQ